MDSLTATVVAVCAYNPQSYPGFQGPALNPAPIAVVVLSTPNVTPTGLTNSNPTVATNQIQLPIYSASDLASYVPGGSVTLQVATT